MDTGITSRGLIDRLVSHPHRQPIAPYPNWSPLHDKSKRPYEFAGPGLTRQAYINIFTAGGETGWWDEHGVPGPWPEDFLPPDSG